MNTITAFDADVLIYAAAAGHPLGDRVARLFTDDATQNGDAAGIGSVLLLPEVLAKPMRTDPDSAETTALAALLSRLELLPFDEPTARLSVALAVAYGLHAADAAHLATAILGGATHFLTNNRKDFPRSITGIEVVYPGDLP